MKPELKERVERILNGGPGSGCRGGNCGRPKGYQAAKKDAEEATKTADASDKRASGIYGQFKYKNDEPDLQSYRDAHEDAVIDDTEAYKAHIAARDAALQEGRQMEAQNHAAEAKDHFDRAALHHQRKAEYEGPEPRPFRRLFNSMTGAPNSYAGKTDYTVAAQAAKEASTAAASPHDDKDTKALHLKAHDAHVKARDEAVKAGDGPNADYHNIMAYSHKAKASHVPDVVSNTWSDAAREAAAESRHEHAGGCVNNPRCMSAHDEATKASAVAHAAPPELAEESHRRAAQLHRDAMDEAVKAGDKHDAEYHQGLWHSHNLKADSAKHNLSNSGTTEGAEKGWEVRHGDAPEDADAGVRRGDTFSVRPARYADGKMVVSSISGTGFKRSGGRLAEALNGKFVHRDKGYQMSPRNAELWKKLHARGWDAPYRITDAPVKFLHPTEKDEQGRQKEYTFKEVLKHPDIVNSLTAEDLGELISNACCDEKITNPFGPWKDFESCLSHMTASKDEKGGGYDDETAKKVCGKLKAKLENAGTFNAAMFKKDENRVTNDGTGGGSGGAGGSAGGAGSPAAGATSAPTGRIASLSSSPTLGSYAEGSSQRRKKLREELQNAAKRFNGWLPNAKYVTKKEVDLARQQLPAMSGEIRPGSKKTVTLSNSVSKGKKIEFTYNTRREFSKNKNGEVKGSWTGPVPVESEDFLKS